MKNYFLQAHELSQKIAVCSTTHITSSLLCYYFQSGSKKAWAEAKCEILRSGNVFADCRKKLRGEENAYYKECVFDACGCASSTNCECLCAAIANMAARCNQLGVAVEWRSKHLCRKYHFL